MFNLQTPAHLHYLQNLAQRPSHNISQATCEPVQLSQLVNFKHSEMQRLKLEYASLSGNTELKERICLFHRFNKSYTNNTLLFCGAQEAIMACYLSLLKPDDEVIVFSPNYPSLYNLTPQLGFKTHIINLYENDDWHVNTEALQKCINEKTKLIILSVPNNPTGAILTVKQAKEILTIAQQKNIYILIDEVAAHLDYHQLGLVGLFKEYPLAVTIGSVAKSLSMSGVRLGWAIVPSQPAFQSMYNFKLQSSVCTSLLDEKIAFKGLMQQQEIVDRNIARAKNNLQHLHDFMAETKLFSWSPPQAGILACIKLTNNMDAMKFTQFAQEKHDLLILPASLFGASKQHLRIGFGQQNFIDQLSILSKAAKDFNNN